MQHWMKNQLVKEAYTDKWEDIVRSGFVKQPPSPEGDVKQPSSPEGSSQTKLPAEFGTKDKVPAPGTAPMGLSDYKDSNQWADRAQQLEQQDPQKPNEGLQQPESPTGYLGGDGAQSSPADDSSSSSAQQSSQQSAHKFDAAPANRNQNAGHLPLQASTSVSGQGRNAQLNQASTNGSGDHRSNGALPPSSPSKSNGSARHAEGSIGDASQLRFKRNVSESASSTSNGSTASQNGQASRRQQDSGRIHSDSEKAGSSSQVCSSCLVLMNKLLYMSCL